MHFRSKRVIGRFWRLPPFPQNASYKDESCFMRSRVSTLSILSIVSDSWKNLEIWKGGKKLPALCAPSLFSCRYILKCNIYAEVCTRGKFFSFVLSTESFHAERNVMALVGQRLCKFSTRIVHVLSRIIACTAKWLNRKRAQWEYVLNTITSIYFAN